MVELTRKGVKFAWSPACKKGFTSLKLAFTSAPILHYFDLAKQIFVEYDTSDYVSFDILSQKDNNDILYFVAFIFKKHTF